MWKEEYCGADMMTSMEQDWSVSLDSDWELFGGEMKFTGVNGDFDGGALHADGSLEVDSWQTVEDDILSVCSSATSWSGLHGNSLHETYSEIYGDLCKHEDYGKFDEQLCDELIADITSCMNDDLPVSLEQFYEINRLVDGAAELGCSDSDSHYLLLNTDVIESEMVGTEPGESDEDKDADLTNHTDTLQLAVSDADSGTDPCSPEAEIASFEYEELYEESVTAVNDAPTQSTISRDELQDLVARSCDMSVVKFGLSDDIEMESLLRRHPPTEPTNSRRLRKKEQNKTAAMRYRMKKRSEQGLVMTEYSTLERKNIELRTRLDAMTKEISYLKSLIDELCP